MTFLDIIILDQTGLLSTDRAGYATIVEERDISVLSAIVCMGEISVNTGPSTEMSLLINNLLLGWNGE